MRREISLYIEDRLVDLSDDALVLMNYTFEDLSNPTTVKNSYSKTITLEGTSNNNEIFGNIWKLDRRTLLSEVSHAGVAFNATQKTPFRIYNGLSEVIVSGYCKLDRIERKGADIKYKVSLFGGLGSFINALTYNEDGSLRTLADMQYQDAYETWVSADTIRFPSGGRTKEREVKYAWDNFGEDGDLYNVINFGVFYEGIPKDFDADKMLSNYKTYKNYPDSRVDGGITYKMRGRASLIRMANKHTAWEMKDLRWYLLRPVFNLWELVNALRLPENVGGMKVKVSRAILNETGGKYDIDGLWVTLRRFTKADRTDDRCLVNVLRTSLTPADYLIALAKFFGWVLLYNEASGVEIMPRSEFFARRKDEIIDLSERIDLGGASISPNTATSRYYQMGGAKAVVGEYPALYKETYGKEYGSQTINTGYGFNDETSIITDKNKIVEGCDAVENLSIPYGDITYETAYTAHGIYNGISNNEAVTQELWNGNESKEFPCILKPQVAYPFGYGAVRDWLRKTQLHKRNNEPEDGSNMFVRYRRKSGTPLTFKFNLDGTTSQYQQPYFITDDISEMDSLNQGTPCWNMTGINSIPVTQFPLFDREGEHDRSIVDPLWFGTPREVSAGILGISDYGEGIFEKFWKRYLTDRYDVDTKVLRCKANLSGIEVNQSLLGRFFWYDNAYWVLNKVENYSLTTDDLVECEFIKVKDIQNYIA